MSSDGKFFLSVVIAAILIIGGVVFYSARKPAATTNVDTAVGEKRGPEDAKVKIIEFGDFQCPACGAAEPKLRIALNNNPADTQLIFRNFPLPMHSNAIPAAKAAAAAGVQQKFWEMHDILFDKQEEWSNLSDPMPKFLEYAQQLSLDTNKFQTDWGSDAVAKKVTDDQAYGNSLGVNQTPTFYVNGKQIAGGLSVEQWQQEIDQAKSR